MKSTQALNCQKKCNLRLKTNYLNISNTVQSSVICKCQFAAKHKQIFTVSYGSFFLLILSEICTKRAF